ncbi:MAG: M3 family metallopeptidase [Desulfomicrobium sp.]|nr:M3 family metallopeptidase [Desulfomicrobium sp.]
MKTNPLLHWEYFPQFSRIRPEHVLPAVNETIEQSLQELIALEQTLPKTWHGLLVPLERLIDRVSRTWGLVTHLYNVTNSPALREVHSQAQPEVIRFYTRLGQSKPVYTCLMALKDSPDFSSYSQALQRIITILLRDATLQGVGLTAKDQEHFNHLSQELARLTTTFANNVLDATKAYVLTLTKAEQVRGLPQTALALAATMARAQGHAHADQESGPWCITLDLPSFLSFMQHAKDRDLREEVYRAYITRASNGATDNSFLIKEILLLRQELANLLGYENFAAMSLARKMASSVKDIEILLQKIRTAATDPALNDLVDLEDLAQSQGQSEELKPWDLMYWAERLKEQRFNLQDEEVRPYFPLPAVLQGLFDLVGELFDITIVEQKEMETWHPHVSYFIVLDENQKEKGGFFLDPYARPEEKRGGAWMDEMVGRSTICAPTGTSLRLPVAYINCNQRPGLDDAPSLMSFSEVTTLFHEFGHALQHLLTTVDHGLVAGIANVEWDAVELSSQFMENWCYEKDILARLARHYQTHEPMPPQMQDQLLQARNFRAGSNALRQISFALIDLALHTADPHNLDPVALAHHISQEILPMPPLPEDRFLCSFTHIFAGGYAAGYYSYKWAEVLSADAFALFMENNKDQRHLQGRRFRNTVLALGGSRHPMEIFKLFRGRNPDPNALLRQEGLLLQSEGS